MRDREPDDFGAFKIVGLGPFSLIADDVDASAEYYQQKFGFDLRLRLRDVGPLQQHGRIQAGGERRQRHVLRAEAGGQQRLGYGRADQQIERILVLRHLRAQLRDLSTGVVSEVDMTSGNPILMVGPMPVALTDIAGVQNLN